MATLERIRNRAGILVAVVIGVALLAFIMGDLFSSGTSLFTNNQFEIAEISGHSIPVQEYQRRVDKLVNIYQMNTGTSALDEATMDAIQEQTWNSLVEEYILSDEYEDLGISVSPEEVLDMVQGNNPHPIIRQMFTNPETGQFNSAAVIQFLRNMDQDATGEQKAFWLYLENEILRERKRSKYNNLISKGLYASAVEAKEEFIKQNKRVNFDYVMERYAKVPDTAVNVTEDDIESYYKKHKNQFKQTASRDIEYVTFEIQPSESDQQEALKYVTNIVDEFAKTENNAQFVNLNSDVPYNSVNRSREELSVLVADSLFDAEPGTMIGPYLENDAYKLSKLDEINFVPDSVKARHILLRPDPQMQQTLEDIQPLADSLQNVLENGGDFTALALEYSQDGSAQQGGDLGWFQEGMMVKPFNDAAFESQVGEIKVVESQFGIHLIEVTSRSPEQKKVKVATIVRNIVPGSVTYQDYYSQASEFAGINNTAESFENAVAEQNITKRVANNLRENDKEIAGLESPRELVRWAFEAEEGDVSEVFELGDEFVVALLTQVREKGIAPLDQVRTQIETSVRKEKKAAFLISQMEEQMGANTTLEQLASNTNTEVKSATGITFVSFSIPGAGIEPVIIGASLQAEQNELVGPLEGTNGVYVLQVTNITPAPESDQFAAQQTVLNNGYSQRVNFEAFEALREKADIEDSRSKFY